MERRAKERLIGACILVVLAVALVPELLSGPKTAAPAAAGTADALRLPGNAAGPVRNVTVDLATAKPATADPADPPPAPPSAPAGGAPNAASQPSAAGAAGGVPAAPAGASTANMTPAAAVPAAATPANSGSAAAADGRSIETPAAVPTSGQAFAVQLGSFANRSNAEKLVHQLKAQGFAIYLNTEGSGAAARYRVRVGPLTDREAAERMIAKLKGQGHAASIVGPR